MSNVIVHVTNPLFIEYMLVDLNRETTPNVVNRICDVINHLHKLLNLTSIHVFLSNPCNGMRHICKVLQTKHVVKCAYGCVAHRLQNLYFHLTKTADMTETVKLREEDI